MSTEASCKFEEQVVVFSRYSDPLREHMSQRGRTMFHNLCRWGCISLWGVATCIAVTFLYIFFVAETCWWCSRSPVFCWYSRIFTGGRFDRSGWKGGCRVYLGNCQYPAIPDPYCDTPMIPDNDWLVFVKTPTAYKQGPAVIRHFIPIDLNPWQFHYICQFKCDKVTCVCDLDFLLLL